MHALVFGARFVFGLLLFADAAAAQEELDQLLEAERDEEAGTDGDEVEGHGDRLRGRETYYAVWRGDLAKMGA